MSDKSIRQTEKEREIAKRYPNKISLYKGTARSARAPRERIQLKNSHISYSNVRGMRRKYIVKSRASEFGSRWSRYGCG